MDTIGKRLKFIIEQRNQSQGEFAKILNLPRQIISNYVNDLSKPNYDVLFKLYKDLNINLNWFITGEGIMFNQTPNEALKEELRKEFEELLKSKGL
jgi:transcriptional regulator with XRE-family HTH domain